MTTIIGVQSEWGCSIYADGQTTAGDYRPFSDPALRKVVKRGEYLLATAGPGAVSDAVAQGWMPPPFSGRDGYREMVTTVVPHLRRFLSKELNYDMSPTVEGDKFTALIAVHGVIYEVEVDGTVLIHPDGLFGIGTGAPYAIGALYAGADIGSALRIAEVNDVYTGPPFVMEQQPKPGREVPTNDRSTDDDSSTEPADGEE